MITVNSNYKTKCLAIYSDVAKDAVRDKLVTGKISGYAMALSPAHLKLTLLGAVPPSLS